MRNIWFTSDQHYGHENIIKYCNRPFRNVQHMDAELIRRHNNVVKDKDVVVHVGDFGFGGASNVLKQLNGTHILVLGNHDPKIRAALGFGFDMVCHEIDMIICKRWVRIRHHPYRPSLIRKLIRRWFPNDIHKRPTNRGHWLLHGHTHSRTKVNGQMINVGVDANNFEPISLKSLEKIIHRRST